MPIELLPDNRGILEALPTQEIYVTTAALLPRLTLGWIATGSKSMTLAVFIQSVIRRLRTRSATDGQSVWISRRATIDLRSQPGPIPSSLKSMQPSIKPSYTMAG